MLHLQHGAVRDVWGRASWGHSCWCTSFRCSLLCAHSAERCGEDVSNIGVFLNWWSSRCLISRGWQANTMEEQFCSVCREAWLLLFKSLGHLQNWTKSRSSEDRRRIGIFFLRRIFCSVAGQGVGKSSSGDYMVLGREEHLDPHNHNILKTFCNLCVVSVLHCVDRAFDAVSRGIPELKKGARAPQDEVKNGHGRVWAVPYFREKPRKVGNSG